MVPCRYVLLEIMDTEDAPLTENVARMPSHPKATLPGVAPASVRPIHSALLAGRLSARHVTPALNRQRQRNAVRVLVDC